MKRTLALLLLLVCLPLQAGDRLPYFSGFDTLSRTAPNARVLVMLFSQPDCRYCDLVREEFLLPLQSQQRTDLAIRELKVPSDTEVRNATQQLVTPGTFAKQYAIAFYPSVLVISPDGTPLGEPLIGISSRDFYGFYLDQAINKALAASTP
ncbi:thioredoxin domain-containing protein [Marinobacterium weihaiense]|uniref:Thioredoxin-related protein n=1 Tax=Marinobacterium weihaiense TaxID=2851016 RepID=A0ABS6M735_9GAMM|nr:hypothetical protein [Marinobacterium weihaiense]MBV0931980.1 hypothetical protein [Marinobacterium weihaiense]